MKTFFGSLKRQAGFTLVELMVVVAIIGLLSAVAVPNFKKYQAKSKVSEAKLQLSALYTAQTSFFSDYNMYANCLRYMGFDPAAEVGNRYYGVGFVSGMGAREVTAHDSAVNSGMDPAGCPNATTAVSGALAATVGATWYPAGKGVGANIISTDANMTANAAGVAGNCVVPATQLTGPSGGNCIGTMADTTQMTFQAAAVGVISGDAATPALASGLTINNTKLIRSVVQGY